MEQPENNTSVTNHSTGMWQDLCRKVRKPCLVMDLDLQMQVYPDYDATPSQGSQGTQKAGGQAQQQNVAEQAICDKQETISVKWRIADMVVVGMIASVTMSLLCCVKHMCNWMK